MKMLWLSTDVGLVFLFTCVVSEWKSPLSDKREHFIHGQNVLSLGEISFLY
jgi:hypothetical protein